MRRRFWLIFAQAVTVILALMFIVATLKPQWLQRQGQFGKQLAEPIVALQEVAPSIGSRPAQSSYAEAPRKAMPAVVNVFSSKDGTLPRRPARQRSAASATSSASRQAQSDEPPASTWARA